MSDTNVFVIKGRLVRDSELKYFGQKNTAKLTFSLANGTGFGEYKKTHYFDCYMIEKSAEGLEQYLPKGKEIVATGEIEQDRWDDKNTGDKKSKVRLFVKSVDFTSGSKYETQNMQQTNQTQPTYNKPDAMASTPPEFDDIPF